jgi:very-short-patch-repair endonuclease
VQIIYSFIRVYRKQLTEGRIRYAERWKKCDPAAYKRILKGTKAIKAERMRRNPTAAERDAGRTLKPMGFIPQAIILGYIPDFVHPKFKIIVEIDGPIHNEQKHYDAQRDHNLKERGYTVLRFPNFTPGEEIKKAVLAHMQQWIDGHNNGRQRVGHPSPR